MGLERSYPIDENAQGNRPERKQVIERATAQEVLKAAETSKKVFFKLRGAYDGTTFFMTISEFMELADCHIRERRRIATRIVRKVPLEYPIDYSTDKKLGPKAPWRMMKYGMDVMAYRGGSTRWISLPMPERMRWPGISMADRDE